MTQSSSQAKVPKDRAEPAKAPSPLPIDLEEGEDDQTSPKSCTRGEASHKTHDDGSNDSDKLTEMIDEPEPKSTTPTGSG